MPLTMKQEKISSVSRIQSARDASLLRKVRQYVTNLVIGLSWFLFSSLNKCALQELSSDPKQKRKAQNRAAQRAFRERKEKYVAELQERIRQLEQENALSEDLVKENEALKEKVRKLQEENYVLKGAQFTFEFPIGSSSTTTTTPESKFLPTTSTDSSSSPSNSLDHGNSASSAAESPLYALDQSGGSSSDEGQNQSPQSLEDNNIMEHKTDDKLFGGGTGNMTTGTNLFSPIPASQDLEFLAVPGPGDDGYVAPASFDLFQSKDNLFSDYRVPADNDFWSHTDSLAALFGDDGGDLFGLNGPAPFTQDQEPGAINAFDLSSSNTLQQHQQQQQQEQEPSLQTMTPVQRKAYEELQEFKAKGMRLYDVREQFEKHCPDFNIDELCSELKEKANCSMNKDVVTDREINMFLRCF